MKTNRILKYKLQITILTIFFFLSSLVSFPVFDAYAENVKMESQTIKIRFSKADGDYTGWDIWSWWDGQGGKSINFDHKDENGVYALVEVPLSGVMGLIVRKNDWSLKATKDVNYDLTKGEKELVITAGKIDKDNPADYTVVEADLYRDLEKLTVNVHYNRTNNDYEGWNLWNWIPGGPGGEAFPTPAFDVKDDFGMVATFEHLNVTKEAHSAAFIIRTNDWAKDGGDKVVDLAYADCNGVLNVYIKQGDNSIYYVKPEGEIEPEEPSRVPVLVGDLQNEISGGAEEDWNAASVVTIFKEVGDGFYTLTGVLPAGDYQYKIAFGGWGENYGEDGKFDGANMKISLTEETEVTFFYSDKTHLTKNSTNYTPKYNEDKRPRIAGTLQMAMGEEENWKPELSTLKLYDHNFDGVYSVALKAVPKGSYEFKVTIGGSWDENYGDNGNNFKLDVPETSDVDIIFDSNSKTILTKVHLPVIGEFDGQVNGGKLYHNTWDNLFKLPFGAVAEGTSVTVRMKSEKGDLQYARVLVRNSKTNRSDLYNMDKVSTLINEDGSKSDIWEATFTPNEMGVYGYKFIAGDGDAVKYYGEDGAEGKVGIVGDKNVQFFQLTVYDKDYKTPDWMKEAVVYQIFPDRFSNGDKSNDTAKDNARGNEPIETPASWNSLPDNPRLGENNKDDVEGPYSGDGIWSNDFFGGDIKGIQNNLDYLQGLGINTIYLNPISMAGSNHKYDATDYKRIDSMFGTEEEFKELTTELENRDMKLIIDGVFNHVGDDSIYFDRYGKYNTVGAYEYWAYVYDVMNNDKITQESAMVKADEYFVKAGQKFSEEKFHLWFNIKNTKIDIGTTTERYDYQAWWGFDSLPEFKSMTKDEAIALGLSSASDEFVDKLSEWNNKALVNYIYKDEDSVAKQWINWGADGWRLDVANEVDTVFWNEFREEMKTHNPQTLILGEIWDDASKYFIGDQYDSVMNYRIRAGLLDYLKNGNAERLNDSLMAVYEDYPKEAFYSLMNLMGSHDVARAQYILGGGSDAVERAEFGEFDAELGKQRLKLAALFEFGYPGAPTLYYGDEAGLIGSKDPDNRRTYPWGKEDGNLIDFYEAIGTVRKDNKDLFSHGDIVTLYSKDSIFAYGRSYKEDHGIVLINPTKADVTITLDMKKFTGNGTEFVDGLEANYKVVVMDGKVEVSIPAMTGRMLTSSNVISLPQAVTSVLGEENNSAVTLTWNPVQGAKAYKVYASTFKGSDYKEVKTVTESEAVVDGLVNGERVYFAVSTVDENDNESALTWSEGFIPHYNIGWFGNLTEVTVNKIDIANPINICAEVWIENVSQEPGVSAGLAGRLLVKYPGDSEFTIVKAAYKGEKGNNDELEAQLVANKPGMYEYKFEATTKGIYGFNYNDSIMSTESKFFEVEIGDDLMPTETVSLNQPEPQSGEVNLSWSIGETNNIVLYEIVRNGQVVARIKDGTITSYKDTDVRNKTEYTYKVIAYSNGGKSVESNEVKVTPDLVMVEVTFKLNAPAYTPFDTKVTIPGSMNGWSVDAWEMTRNGAVTTDWTYTIAILEGEEIQYKYVKGSSWDQEALMNYTNPKAANQSKYGCTTGEGGNEKITVVNEGDGKMLVENEVIRWKDMPVVILDPAQGSTTNNESIVVRGNAMLDPNLTINGEAVKVDENGDFAHEAKLEIGKNSIKIHIEPTEENKNNPDIFNNSKEAIGFATKDLALEITRVAKDNEAVNGVINLINSLPETISLENKALVAEAREAYNALTEGEKALVPESLVNKLIKAENDIKALEEGVENQKAADAVVELINKIPAKVTLKDKDLVVNARKAYEALTDEQKELVSEDSLNKLVKAEREINKLEEAENNTGLPQTGERPIKPFYFGAAMLLIALGIFVLIRKNNSHKKAE